MLAGKLIVKLSGMFSAVAALALFGFMPGARLAAQSSGDVYVQSNQEEANAVIVFHRNADGTLTEGGRFPTDASGTGRALASQGSVVLSGDNRMLFVVNAGSSSITVFSVRGDSLTRMQTIESGGSHPISLTVSHGLLYVLNAGDEESANITGFRIQPGDAPLARIEGSTQAVPGGSEARPTEVSFSRAGNVLLVTEMAASQTASFVVNEAGQARLVDTYPSSEPGPFGQDWSISNVAIQAYTNDNAPTAAGAASYQVSGTGEMTVISPAVHNNQTGSSWVVVARNGNVAFVSNPPSGTISSYMISTDPGQLSLRQSAAASVQSQASGSLFPSDLALSNNNRYLYARNAANGSISGFRVGEGGSLTPVAQATGLPESASGIAAR